MGTRTYSIPWTKGDLHYILEKLKKKKLAYIFKYNLCSTTLELGNFLFDFTLALS
jgi:hypothetical protein